MDRMPRPETVTADARPKADRGILVSVPRRPGPPGSDHGAPRNMSTRKSSIFYGILIAFVVGRRGHGHRLAPRPDAIVVAHRRCPFQPPTARRSAGPIDATTFRTIAHDARPSVVSIITTRRGMPSDLQGVRGPLRSAALPQGRRAAGAAAGPHGPRAPAAASSSTRRDSS